jgi:nicotinate dehydrogenase subunit B
VRTALDGNVCRCAVHARILRAVERTADHALPDPSLIASDRLAPESRLDARDGPWDLQAAEGRGYFDALGDGLVAVLEPSDDVRAWSGAWTTTGGAWLHVGTTRGVTAFSGKVEMGQGNARALARIVAAAVGVDVSAVRMVMADTDVSPYDLGTFGSRSVPDAGSMLRAAGWTALDALVRLAAERLEVSASDLVAHDGRVRTRDGAREVSYGDLLVGQRRIETVRGRPSRPAALADAGMVDRPRPSASDVAIVTGRPRFATDISLPNMLVGAELQPPAPGARLVSADASGARSIAGVTVVEEDDFVGVAAADAATADRAIAAIRAEWSVPDGPSNATLVEHLRSHPRDAGGWDGVVDERTGDVDTALDRADARVDATYTAAFVAHMPLETRAAVAAWRGGRMTVWTGSQMPFGARAQVADALGVDEGAVRVIVPPVGGGFGGKHGAGPGIAAARLARAAGRPVRVRWRQADEFVRGHVRPAAVIDVRIGASRDGAITAIDLVDVNAGARAMAPPYRIANQRLHYQPAESPLAQDSYRALSATANTFARESAVDELAHAIHMDPLELRLANVDDERLAAVLRAAAERVGWRRRATPAGEQGGDSRGLGIAGSIEKDARVATCAEVVVRPSREVRVLRLVTAFDCGAIVDPENLTNQVEGATIMALGPALFEAVALDHGRVVNPTLAGYRVPRFSDVPEIEVVLVDRPDIPSAGGGEVPLIAVAPAIANAIFAACGRRIRSMPLTPDAAIEGPANRKSPWTFEAAPP